MKFNSIYAGDTYWTVSHHKMGNTTMSTVAVHPVTVVSCDSVKETVIARWNGNEPRTYREREYSKWRKNKPLLVADGWGHRLATRDEIKAKAAATQPKE